MLLRALSRSWAVTATKFSPLDQRGSSQAGPTSRRANVESVHGPLWTDRWTFYVLAGQLFLLGVAAIFGWRQLRAQTRPFVVVDLEIVAPFIQLVIANVGQRWHETCDSTSVQHSRPRFPTGLEGCRFRKQASSRTGSPSFRQESDSSYSSMTDAPAARRSFQIDMTCNSAIGASHLDVDSLTGSPWTLRCIENGAPFDGKTPITSQRRSRSSVTWCPA